MGKEYRAAKRERAEASKVHRFWWEHKRRPWRELEAEEDQRRRARVLVNEAYWRNRVRNWRGDDEAE